MTFCLFSRTSSKIKEHKLLITTFPCDTTKNTSLFCLIVRNSNKNTIQKIPNIFDALLCDFWSPWIKLPGVDSYATTKSNTRSSLIVIATKHNPDKQAFLMFCYQESLISSLTPWRNGSASDSRSEGCVFESRRGQNDFFLWDLWNFRIGFNS